MKCRHHQILGDLMGNVTMKQLQREVLLNRNGPMKESNTHVGNVADNFLIRKNLNKQNRQFMKESKSLVGNASKISLR